MRVVTAAFAIAAGLIVLLGYFFPGQLGSLQVLLLDWAVIIAGMAVLVGIFNLAAVHMESDQIVAPHTCAPGAVDLDDNVAVQ